MILDHLDNADRYLALHPAFAAAFRFLRRADLAELPSERYELDGRQLFAMVSQSPPRARHEARLEAHRKYIDIQYLIGPAEEMGWSARSHVAEVTSAYSEEKDFELFGDAPQAYVSLSPGMFAIFFPHDAHAPLIANGVIHKVVVKVALDD